ncbi:MAG: hypothetical protein K6E95_03110 [Lachnospiraceae bacterium]|nr:hypothetical protein [Lachnospiraceae bacterium]
MKQSKDRKRHLTKKTVILIVALGIIIALVIVMLIGTREKREVILKDYGFAFVNTSRLAGIMKVSGSEEDIRETVCNLVPDAKIMITGDDVEYNGETLSDNMPAFFDNNNYIYIPYDEVVVLDKSIKLKVYDGRAFVINGGFHTEEYVFRENAENMLLLSCTRNMFLAMDSFSVTSMGEKFTIDPMNLVLFDGNIIRIASITEETSKCRSYGITEDSIVTVDGHSYIMRDFLGKIGLSVEMDSSVGGLDKMVIDDEEMNGSITSIDESILEIPETTFQYFIGNRYNFPEKLPVFEADEKWYQIQDTFVNKLECNPLYGEKSIYLPDDYGYVDMEQRKQYCLPAITRITKEDDKPYIYVSDLEGNEQKVLSRGVIYDGGENYLFTDSVKLTWKDNEFDLPPLSYISYDGFGRLEFYNKDEDKFYSYILEEPTVKALFDNGNGVDFVSRTVIFEGGPAMIVVPEPEMYRSYFE